VAKKSVQQEITAKRGVVENQGGLLEKMEPRGLGGVQASKLKVEKTASQKQVG